MGLICVLGVGPCVYRVLGGLPRLHFADVLHVLQLPQLGERVVAQGFVQRRVSILILHVQLGFRPHQQLWRPAQDTQ